MAYVGRIETAADALPDDATTELGDLPAPPALPLIGNVHELRGDLLNTLQRWQTAYGEVVQVRFLLGARVVIALGPTANEQVLQDPDKVFASSRGWNDLRHLWGDSILTRDFEDHHAFRKLFTPAFKADRLREYLTRMNRTIADTLDRWPRRPRTVRFLPLAKRLTLNIACDVFAGLDARETRRLRTRFTQAMAAPVAAIPLAIPGNARWRGERAIASLLQFFTDLVATRRETTPGPDLLSQFCALRSDTGETLSPSDIASNIMTFLFAAHDTTTVALTNMLYALARHPEWQARLRAEAQCQTPGEDGGIEYAALGAMHDHELVFKEALRLYTPLQFIARRTVSPTQLCGRELPANTAVMVFPHFTHHMAEWYWQPENFDPERFAASRVEDRQHPFIFTPFGKGAHMCLGSHFALMEVRAILFQLLRSYRFELRPGYRLRMRALPFPHPADGLRLQMTPL